MASFEFDWKANRNFCLTSKNSCDFECQEAEEARENDTFHEFALKLEHVFWPLGPLQKSTFRFVGYYKTLKAAEKAMDNKIDFCEYAFIWNRKGEFVNGVY